MTITMERPVGAEIRAKRAQKKAGGQRKEETQAPSAASPTKTRGEASGTKQPSTLSPTSGHPIPDAATESAQPNDYQPHQEPHLTSDTLPAYATTPAMQHIIDQIVSLHRERQATIKAKTKIILQAKALLRSMLCTAQDYEIDDTKDELTIHGDRRKKLTKAAAKRVDDAFAEVRKDPASEHALTVGHYLASVELFDERQTTLERQMVRLAKQLPVYAWVKSVRGFGDLSFSTIVGECGDIGTYKSVAAVWKRLGLAVIDGRRQGAPGEGATADHWISHGYNKSRRSTSWNARQHVIGDMAKWRPVFGADVRCDHTLTEYQCVYAERARYESAKLGLPITISDKGKESYKMHVANRAHRYVEKRLVKHLYLAWRRGGAL